MIICFDTETSSFVNPSLPPDHPQQARLVELGAILCEDDGTERASLSMIVRPDGWVISPGAAAVHGITQDVAERCGVDIGLVIQNFAHLLDLADLALAYNVKFDKDVMSLELIRMGESRPVEWPSKTRVECIMELARTALNLPPTPRMKRAGRFEAKAPKLSEAYVKLFDEELIGAHSALADARAAKRVWFKIKGLGEPGRSDTYNVHSWSGPRG